MNFPILKRLIPSLSILLAKIINKKEQYYKINNLYFFLDILDPIDREIILKKNYETEEIKKLLIFISKRNVLNFIDIGSNLGYYSFIIRKKFPEIKIFSFEPNQKAFNKLKKTKKKNLIFKKKFKIFNFGLSDKNSVLKMFAQKKHGQPHTNSSIFYGEKKDKSLAISKGKFRIGDEVLKIKNESTVLKIDVEGHELNVLKGIKKLLLRNKCIILIEIGKQNYRLVNNFLNFIGYKKVYKSSLRDNYFYI
ncbi:FkbM family methyltransferase [Pelagibacteraceae bacterium]|nr:FkbM family methyltransferase [Pelagibacteraceae bacterium]